MASTNGDLLSGSFLSSLDHTSLISNPSFVNLSEHYVCPVCQQVLREPVQSNCGHHMCLECCNKLLTDCGEPCKCPSSNKNEDICDDLFRRDFNQDTSMKRELFNLSTYCTNASRGCRAEVPWKDLKNHIDTCPYEGMECLNKHFGCNDIILARDFDEHAKLKCLYRPVECEQCSGTFPMAEMEGHSVRYCPEATVECPQKCGKKSFKRKELKEHEKSCPKRLHLCTFISVGCQFEGKTTALRAHMRQDISDHLELTVLRVGRMELDCTDYREQLRDMTQERNSLNAELEAKHKENEEVKKQLANLEEKVKPLKIHQVGLMERVTKVERRIEEMPRKERIVEQSGDLNDLKLKVRDLETRSQNSHEGDITVFRYGSVSTMADAFTTQLAAHDRQMGIHDVRIAEMDLRFQILETASYDGVIFWKIRDYTRRKQEAVSGRTLSLYSQPFYTSRYGYKMCIRVYLNGDGMGKTTHVSVYFVIMRGEYDSLLTWPFQQKVTTYLLDQGAERRNLSDHFHPDPSSASFRKPQTEMNIASGMPLFVSHSVLENPTNNYLKDDTVFIKLAVETANLRIL